MLTINLMMLASEFATQKFLWLYYYLTHWGFCFSLFSQFTSIKAAQYPRSIWHYLAQFAVEVSLTLDLLITPCFWIILAPYQFTHLNYHDWYDCWMAFHLTTYHLLPLTFTLINVHFTEIKFRPKKEWMIFIIGILYM